MHRLFEYTMQVAAGFFDESSDEYLEGVSYTVAGLVGNNHATAVLELRWRDLLKKYEIKYFKASELNAGEGQFKKFRDDPTSTARMLFSDREKCIFSEIKTAFTDAIVQCSGLSVIGASLILSDYERVRSDYPPARTLSYPYFVCSSVVLMELGVQFNRLNQQYCEQDRMRVRPVFDSHEEYSGRMKQGFDFFCRQRSHQRSVYASSVL